MQQSFCFQKNQGCPVSGPELWAIAPCPEEAPLLGPSICCLTTSSYRLRSDVRAAGRRLWGKSYRWTTSKGEESRSAT